MKYYASSAINCGNSHIYANSPCEDVALVKIDKEQAIAVISDGAGSRKFAKVTAEVLVQELEKYFLNGVLETYIIGDRLYDYLNSVLYKINYPLDDLGATLLFVFVKGKTFYCVHIGDGGVIIKRNQKYEVLSHPENGQFINETFFLPDSSKKHFRVSKCEINDDTMFILASDGVFDLLYDLAENKPTSACEKLENWNIYDNQNSSQLIETSLKNTFSQYTNDDQSIAVLNVVYD